VPDCDLVGNRPIQAYDNGMAKLHATGTERERLQCSITYESNVGCVIDKNIAHMTSIWRGIATRAVIWQCHDQQEGKKVSLTAEVQEANCSYFCPESVPPWQSRLPHDLRGHEYQAGHSIKVKPCLYRLSS
jgi:hypothetical protein